MRGEGHAADRVSEAGKDADGGSGDGVGKNGPRGTRKAARADGMRVLRRNRWRRRAQSAPDPGLGQV